MSRIDKSIETESREIVAVGWEEGDVNATGYGVSFWNDKNLPFIGVIFAQHCEYIINHLIIYFKWWILWYVNYIYLSKS